MTVVAIRTTQSTGEDKAYKTQDSNSIQLGMENLGVNDDKIRAHLKLDGTSLEITATGARIKDEGVTEAKLDSLTAASDGYLLSYDSGSGRLEWIAPTANYTDEQAQDAVGGIFVDSAEIDFTYSDATPSITAVLLTTTVTAAAYGAADSVATFTVDTKGRLTAAATTSIAIAASQTTSGTFADARIAQSNVTQHQAALTILESQITDGAILARVGGTETISGTWTFSNTVTGVTPTVDAHLATKGYVDSVAQGLDAKTSVVAATTADITISNPGTAVFDGVTLSNGERLLVRAQSSASQNGIYIFNGSGSALTRATDSDSWVEFISAFVFVEQGTTYADTGWVCTVDAGGTLESTAVTWVQFSGAGSYLAGNGLTLSGNTFNVGTASAARIVVNADNIDLATTISAGGPTGSATVVPVITYDAYGRLTTVSTSTIAIPSTAVTDFNEAAQDAVGGIFVDSSTIDFTYNDATPSITAAVIAGSIGTTHLADDNVTFAKIQNITDNRLLGRSAGSSGDMMEITVSTGLSLSAGVLTSTITQYTAENAQDDVGTILTDTATIDFTYTDGTPSITADVIDNSITDAKLRDSAALSVIGNATNATANPGDITAGADGYVLRRSGTALGFGQVGTAGIADGAVSEPKLDILNSPTDNYLLGYDNGSGRFEWLSPYTIGDQTKSVVAGENLAANDLISFYNDGGTPKVRKANATDNTKPVHGFVLSAYTSGNTAVVYRRGRVTGMTGLTIGARYYLTTAGGTVSTTAPTTVTNIVQFVGFASSATELEFEAHDYVVIG